MLISTMKAEENPEQIQFFESIEQSSTRLPGVW